MPDTTSTDPSLDTPTVRSPVELVRSLKWALFLGISWTWVIGMFLPVLLIRDLGPWAWFAFAVPNIVGAAAMGWTIRSVDQSVRLVANHRAAARTFSFVTIAFHVFFLIWLVSQVAGPIIASIAFGIALVGMANVLTTNIGEAIFAAVPLIVSLAIAMVAAGRGSLGWPDVPMNAAPLNVLGLSAVCILGFLTCPYLDLTFHRARQACAVAEESKLAFGIGFGVVFGSMIVFTLLYAGAFLHGDRTLRALVGVHIAVQAIYTVSIHAAALREPLARRGRNGVALWIWIAAAVVIAFGSLVMEARGIRVGPLAAGEVVYRTFMSFYGLAVPAYVWLCVHAGRGFLRPHRSEIRMTAIACAVAAPFYVLGFLFGPMAWVLPGVAVVVGARFALDYGRRDLLAEHRAAMLMPSEARPDQA